LIFRLVAFAFFFKMQAEMLGGGGGRGAI